ncbi:hypothetical protein F888_02977 [Acinetobacter courvalinii]|uniref:Uncharacterized protein n=2 Tax=Acinetobacter courvalinii TaxID=280147 RepID=N9RG89_9GAMM|nr:hypothetical protein F888_02977 [Acinetobacter courvalinii]GGH26160.1 hypothetical protein GCM10007354_03390 [Acinetobacter courvalinii]
MMHICIGGDLDGEVVINRLGTYFKASEINPCKKSTYNRQSYIVGEKTYIFWVCAELPYAETTRTANNYLAQKYSYLS